MRGMADNSVDSIVCDPPYELGFMGKSWDKSGIANSIELWREALRVLKPGGHLLAFSGSRTYHRMTWNSSRQRPSFDIWWWRNNADTRNSPRNRSRPPMARLGYRP
jgi:DNA modification methylase